MRSGLRVFGEHHRDLESFGLYLLNRRRLCFANPGIGQRDFHAMVYEVRPIDVLYLENATTQ